MSGRRGGSRTPLWPSAGRRVTGGAGLGPWDTMPKLRPSWRVMVASKRPLRWNSTSVREPVCAGGECGGESLDAGHRVHPADEQRRPLFGRGVGPHEVRESRKAEDPSGVANAAGRQVLWLARRQVGGAVAHFPHDAVRQ